MSSLPGNPHYEAALGQICAVGDMTVQEVVQADATLALAYEQRTANLLHALEMDIRHIVPQLEVDPRVIAERLGIDTAPTTTPTRSSSGWGGSDE